MKRIILHWTAGGYYPNWYEKTRYHFLIDATGKVYAGKPVSTNNVPLKPGYTAHTLNCNGNSIGVAVCCAAGATPADLGKYPPTAKQLLSLVQLVASLCKQYGIACTEKTVLTHGEVQRFLGIPQRGKWDLTVLPAVKGPGGSYLRFGVKKLLRPKGET